MTTLGAIRDMVRQSAPDDWYKLENDGPTYRIRFGYSSAPGNKWRLEADSHSTLLVYTAEVDLTLAYGMYYHRLGMEEPEFEWSQVFSTRSARIGFADIFWRGSLIDRVDYAMVDDHQGIIPMGGAPNALKVTRFEVDVARLLHRINGYVNRFEYFFDRVHFEVTE